MIISRTEMRLEDVDRIRDEFPTTRKSYNLEKDILHWHVNNRKDEIFLNVGSALVPTQLHFHTEQVRLQ